MGVRCASAEKRQKGYGSEQGLMHFGVAGCWRSISFVREIAVRKFDCPKNVIIFGSIGFALSRVISDFAEGVSSLKREGQ